MPQTDSRLTVMSILLLCLTAFLYLCIIVDINADANSENTAITAKNALETHCEQLGALTKAFAEARDQGLPAWKAQRHLSQLMDPDKHNLQTSKKLLAIPGGLAYSQTQLLPISLFALGKYLCMSSAIKQNRQIVLKYLVESATLCQKRMNNDNRIYACIKLAYQLLQEKNKTEKITSP